MRDKPNLVRAADYVTKDMNNKGILIKDRTVRMILRSYFKYVRETLESGSNVMITDVCNMYIKYRRTNTFKGSVVPIVKVQTDINYDLKVECLKKIAQDNDFKNRLSLDIRDDDVEYIKEHYIDPDEDYDENDDLGDQSEDL